ncbi:hypothetical protein KAU37_12040 [Candidatus Bipolaricaulota bacterium]|nr:hypothetical protein [Candidatus Bipolaricaulota bacterium]
MNPENMREEKMTRQLLTLTLEGSPKEKGHVRALDFADEIRRFVTTIESMDCSLSAERKASLYLRIVGLRHESPAVVEMEVCPIDPDVDRRMEATTEFFAATKALQEGRTPKPLGREFMKRLRDFAKPIGESIASVKIVGNGTTLEVTDRLKARIERIASPEETQEEIYQGFIRGVLEYLNIHNRTRTLKIYPDIGPSTVTCHFPDSLREEVVKGMGKYVEVRGMIHLAQTEDFPHEVDVQEIVVFPPEGELPDFDDLLGIAPDITGDKLSEEFIRDVRDAKEAG